MVQVKVRVGKQVVQKICHKYIPIKHKKKNMRKKATHIQSTDQHVRPNKNDSPLECQMIQHIS